MKTIKILTFLSMLTPSIALAAGNHTMGGCGVFYTLFGNQNNSKGTQIGQILLEWFVGTGSFISSSMSTGTSGCTESGEPMWVSRIVETFAEANFEVLKKEMATGEGEYVSTFASLLGATDENVPGLVTLMKNEYTVLFPNETTTHNEMMDHLSGVLESHSTLIS
ncbi:hypothetical protein BVX98_07035 [bacterium F11]|nr:hypothetical protein BVX98_07035 [bacterium F11]